MKVNKILKIEANSIKNIYNTLSLNNVKGKILFVTDSYVNELYGKDVKMQLDKIGKVKSEYVDDNSISYAMILAERVIATDIDYIVGLGGGKVLDVCKYASYISKKDFISIPTTMANDGIASPIAVLKRKDGKPKSLGCKMPSIIIIDTLLIMNSPINLIKAGIGDTISNYMALLDWEFACNKNRDIMDGYAYLMAKNSIEALMRTKYKEISLEFVNALANSLVLSGIAMDFAGSTRPVSGSEHLFSHALDYYSGTKNLHGIQVALGTISILKLLGFDYKELLEYLQRFEVDINPRRLEISEDDFVLAMKMATSMRSNRYTYLHEVNLKDDVLRNLYRELLEEL